MELSPKQFKYLKKKIRGVIGTLKSLQEILVQSECGCPDIVHARSAVADTPESLSSLANDKLPTEPSLGPECDSSQPLESTPSVQPLRYQGMDEHERQIEAGRLKRLARSTGEKSSP